jgi:hypothetical protein
MNKNAGYAESRGIVYQSVATAITRVMRSEDAFSGTAYEVKIFTMTTRIKIVQRMATSSSLGRCCPGVHSTVIQR